MTQYNANINYNSILSYNGNVLSPFMVLPVNISFERWISELQVDFSTDEVPMYFTEDNWREFADNLRRCNTFVNAQIPTHDGFSDWQSWAMRCVQCLGV